MAENPKFGEPATTRKGRNKKALNPSNEANMENTAGKESLPEKKAEEGNNEKALNPSDITGEETPENSAGKESNMEEGSCDLEKQLQELQEHLEKLKIDKKQTEAKLKELKTRNRQQQKPKIQHNKLNKPKIDEVTEANPEADADRKQRPQRERKLPAHLKEYKLG